MSEHDRLEVVHATHYRYAAPVTEALHLACLQPRSDAGQRLEAHAIDIDPVPAQCQAWTDGFGNARLHIALSRPHRELVVRARSVVWPAVLAGADPAASPAWEGVSERLRYRAGALFEPAVEFTMPSPFVPRLPALRDFALDTFTPGRPLAEAALALMRRVHTDFRYLPASTAVDTPLQQVLDQRSGVCQDFAHLMLGALRMLGLAARYISGYLLTEPPPGQAPLLGADASHAWLELYCPDTRGLVGGWLGLDPTNAVEPGSGHVRLAVGRDYGDVTPLRGVIRGGGRHELRVAVDTRRVSADRARLLLE